MASRVGLLLGVVALAAISLIPSGLHQQPGLGSRPAYAAGVAAMMALWWLFDALPMAVTACVPLVLYPLLGVFGPGLVDNLAQSFAPFLDGYLVLFLGGMVLGAGMEECGLHRRVALHIMRVVGSGPAALLMGMMLSTTFVSMWISNTATAVMMLPIAVALVKQMEAQCGGVRLPNFGAAVTLAVAYGSNVGGMGTKIGTGTNSIFCGFASRVLHRDIGFLEYIVVAFPFVVIMVPLTWWMLWRHARKDSIAHASGAPLLQQELDALGPMGRNEKRVAVIFSAAAFLWIISGLIKDAVAPHVPALWPGFTFQAKHVEATIGAAAGCATLVSRSVGWTQLKRIPWDTLMLLGGSFCMAGGLEGSGFSSWLAAQLHGLAELPALARFAAATVSTVGLSAVASNTATINVMLNVLPPQLPLLLAATLAASCDFMLPAGTPPNAIVFGSGYIQLPMMMRVGFLLDLFAALILAVYCVSWVEWWWGV